MKQESTRILTSELSFLVCVVDRRPPSPRGQSVGLGWCPKSMTPRGVVTMGDVHLDRDATRDFLHLLVETTRLLVAELRRH